VWFLRAAAGGCGFASSLGAELLARGLASGGFAGGLLGSAQHRASVYQRPRVQASRGASIGAHLAML
jgi:hypothetical protein